MPKPALRPHIDVCPNFFSSLIKISCADQSGLPNLTHAHDQIVEQTRMTPPSIQPGEAPPGSSRGNDLLAVTAGAAGVGAIGVGTAISAPSLLGFGPSGVAAHSVAAAWQQSSIRTVAAQSTFATVQAFSATAPLAPFYGPIIAVAGVGAFSYAVSLKWRVGAYALR
jgi:hypothetical protein